VLTDEGGGSLSPATAVPPTTAARDAPQPPKGPDTPQAPKPDTDTIPSPAKPDMVSLQRPHHH
jgi:hypothetical protein